MYDLYELVIERNDFSRIAKLETLNNPDTFWDDVRKFTRNVHSDHALRRWEILAEHQFDNVVEKSGRWNEFNH